MENIIVNFILYSTGYITIIILGYLINLLIVCMMAHSLNRNVFGWMYVSIFITPIIGITILLCLTRIEQYDPVRRRDREV